MADTITDTDNTAANASGGSMVSFIIAIALMTLMSAGAGFSTGGFLIDAPAPEAMVDKAANAKKTASAKPGVHGKHTSDDQAKSAGDEGIDAAGVIEIINLQPIVTNLADPPKTWVRIEASIALVSTYDGDKNLLSTTIAEDLLMFTRTLTLASLAGSSGIAHYKEDISERARVRSGGAVNQVLLRMLVIE
jgi:flagellar FliL protein